MSDKQKYLVDEIVHKFDSEENSFFKLGSITGEINDSGKDKIEHTVTIIIPKSKIDKFFNQFKTAIDYVEPPISMSNNENETKEVLGSPLIIGTDIHSSLR